MFDGAADMLFPLGLLSDCFGFISPLHGVVFLRTVFFLGLFSVLVLDVGSMVCFLTSFSCLPLYFVF